MKNIGFILSVLIFGSFAYIGMRVANVEPLYIGGFLIIVGGVVAFKVYAAWNEACRHSDKDKSVFEGKEVTVYITEDKRVRGKMVSEPGEGEDFIILRDAQIINHGSSDEEIRDLMAIPRDTIIRMELENLDRVTS